MVQDYSKKTVCVVDNGLFIELAIMLSKSFGKVYYYSPWQSGFVKSNSIIIGEGVPNIERINYVFDIINKVDLWVFPDVYFSDMQVYLASIGKRVFGSRKGDELELYRKESKEHFKKLGLPVGKYAVVKGLDDLREYLKQHDNVYIKLSFTRGDTETFHSENYDNIEPKLDELEHTLGAVKHIKEFIVEDAIDDAVETGIDTICIDGKFPDHAMVGIEVKDKGYIGKIRKYSELPKEITHFNDVISDTLKKYKYRNFYSTEIRVTKEHKDFMTDLCSRAGSPPNELYQNMYLNLADIMWFGAEGECLDVEFKDEYGAEVLIISNWADKNWQAIEFPESIRDNVKLRNLTIINKKYYAAPQAVGIPEIGAVVASGKTMEEAIKNVQKLAEQVKGHYIEIPVSCLDSAQEELKKLEDFNIKLF